jgi:hypothetical protein
VLNQKSKTRRDKRGQLGQASERLKMALHLVSDVEMRAALGPADHLELPGEAKEPQTSGQSRAMRYGIDGMRGNLGNVESASYRF